MLLFQLIHFSMGAIEDTKYIAVSWIFSVVGFIVISSAIENDVIRHS